MKNFEDALKQFELFKKKQFDLLLEIKDVYDLDDCLYEESDSIKEEIDAGDIELEWFESRDLNYIDDILRCYQMLMDALKLSENDNKKDSHNAEKSLETLMRIAREIKKSANDDIKKAQEVINAMDEIIDVCDLHRK